MKTFLRNIALHPGMKGFQVARSNRYNQTTSSVASVLEFKKTTSIHRLRRRLWPPIFEEHPHIKYVGVVNFYQFLTYFPPKMWFCPSNILTSLHQHVFSHPDLEFWTHC